MKKLLVIGIPAVTIMAGIAAFILRRSGHGPSCVK